MHVRHLSIADFRSYAHAELPLAPGVTTLVGLNGQGKTNLVEAIGYVATLGSHRVAQDAPLVAFGAEHAVVRVAVDRGGRETLVELEITPGRANRAKLNRSPVPRTREVLGSLRTVLFAPEDLELVKGDPGARRRFLDDLLVQRQPRWAGVRGDYDKIVKQRNALLKSAAPTLRGRRRRYDQGPVDDDRAAALHTLDVWNGHLAQVGAQLLYARLRLMRDLAPYLAAAYDEVSSGQSDARIHYRSSLLEPMAERIAGGEVPEIAEIGEALLDAFAQVRDQEVDRGVTLVGPHRDDVVLTLGELPAKGYASHGESWSFALGLRLAAFELLRHDLGEDPVLILDDVFAELDARRRERLAARVAGAEQVIITAAVAEDIPASLAGAVFHVKRGEVRAATQGPIGSEPQDEPPNHASSDAGAVSAGVSEAGPPADLGIVAEDSVTAPSVPVDRDEARPSTDGRPAGSSGSRTAAMSTDDQASARTATVDGGDEAFVTKSPRPDATTDASDGEAAASDAVRPEGTNDPAARRTPPPRGTQGEAHIAVPVDGHDDADPLASGRDDRTTSAGVPTGGDSGGVR